MYKDWIVVNVSSVGADLRVRNAKAVHGKFHAPHDKDTEINVADINKIVVKDGQRKEIAACGRSAALYGSEGSFDLYDADTLVGSYTWSCPIRTPTNKSDWTRSALNFKVEFERGNLNSGAIGRVDIACVKSD